MITTRRFDFNYKPLELSRSITTNDSVADRQSYDAYSGEYIPDYTLTPLVLNANVSVIDKDGVIDSGKVNKQLANIKWYEIVGGEETLITQGVDYSYGVDGAEEAGQITVKKNVKPGSAVTLRFEAEYVDPRTGQVFDIMMSHLLKCKSETVDPILMLDASPQTLYNPLRHGNKQTVNARLMLGSAEAPEQNRSFVWEKMRGDGTWSEVGSDILDYDVEVSADTASATVDRTLMGDELHLRCRAKYDPDGDLASVALSDASPMQTVVFTRRIPQYWKDILKMPYNIPQTPFIYPEFMMRDTIGVFEDKVIEDTFAIDWYMATNKTGGATLTYQKIGEGLRPELSTSLMSKSIGGVLAVEETDRGPLCAWADSDGSVITDADGNVFIFK